MLERMLGPKGEEESGGWRKVCKGKLHDLYFVGK
jgi:hypothetical protein